MRSVLLRGPIAPRIGWQDGRLAELHELESVHDPQYIASIRDACEAGGRRFGSTTVLSATSWQPALAAAGTTLAAADAVIAGDAAIGYALVRPPGHHAGPASPTATASSTTSRSPPSGSGRRARSGWPSSTGTSTTGTARKPASTSVTTSSRSRCTCGTAAGGRRTPRRAAPRSRARRGRRTQRQRRAEAGQRRRRLRRGVPARRRAGARPVPAGRADRRERPGCERVRRQRQDEREHGGLPRDRTERARERRSKRRAAPARPGGRLRADVRGVLPARDPRGRARNGSPAGGPARLHARRPDARDVPTSTRSAPSTRRWGLR